MNLPKNSKLIFRGIVGSQSYGLATETSDTDYKSVYIQSNEDILSNGYIPQIDINKDDVAYEIRRFLELLSIANPNFLELLYLPEHCIVETSKEWDYLLKHKQEFLSKKAYNTYSGYAKTQLSKSQGLNKKFNWEKSKTVRKDILDFCKVIDREQGEVSLVKDWLKEEEYDQSHVGLSHITGFRDCFRLYLDDIKWASDNHRFENIKESRNYKGIGDENTNEPRKSVIEKYRRNDWKCILYFNREAYSTHCKDYNLYKKWLRDRNENRVATNKKHGQDYDSKNLLHLVRLIMTAQEIPLENTIKVDRTKNREYLLSIKRGEVDLEDIIKEWTEKVDNLKELYDKSKLKDEVNRDFICNLELKLRNYDL